MIPQSMLAGVLLASALAPIEDPFPTYRVTPGTVLERAYTSSTKLESEPARVTIDGTEVGAEGGVVKLRTDDAREMSVTDTIRAVADGRPGEFSRKFGECTNQGTETLLVTPPGGSEDVRSTTRERSSLFTGKTVRFTWDDDAEEYAATSDDESLGKDVLADLQADSDWLVLLEGGPREKGAAFELEASTFAHIGNPLGELRWQEDGKEVDPTSRSIVAQFAANIEGKVQATWLGSREIDGRACSVFEVEAQLESHAEAEIGDGKRDVEIELEYEGEVVFDLEAGRLASYAFEADAHVVQTLTRAVKSPDGTVEVIQTFDLRGKAKHALTVTSG